MDKPVFLHEIDAATAERPYEFNIPRFNFNQLIGRWILAVGIAAVVVIAAILAATTPAAVQFLSAGLWGVGFIFLALALEVGIKRVSPYVLTGIALPTLALLGSYIAPVFSILAGVIVAAWLAVWIACRD